jgi:hypothetical protein
MKKKIKIKDVRKMFTSMSVAEREAERKAERKAEQKMFTSMSVAEREAEAEAEAEAKHENDVLPDYLKRIIKTHTRNMSPSKTPYQQPTGWMSNEKTAMKHLKTLQNHYYRYSEAVKELLKSQEKWITFELQKEWIGTLLDVPYYLFDLSDKLIRHIILKYKSISDEEEIIEKIIELKRFDLVDDFLTVNKSSRLSIFTNKACRTKSFEFFKYFLKHSNSTTRRLRFATLLGDVNIFQICADEIKYSELGVFDIELDLAIKYGRVEIIKWYVKSSKLDVNKALLTAIIYKNSISINYIFSVYCTGEFSFDLWKQLVSSFYTTSEHVEKYFNQVVIDDDILVNSLGWLDVTEESNSEATIYLATCNKFKFIAGEIKRRFAEQHQQIAELHAKVV